VRDLYEATFDVHRIATRQLANRSVLYHPGLCRDHRYCLQGFAMQITLYDAQMASPSRVYGGPYFKELSYQGFPARS
jgi:hypothetical protein